MNREQKGAVIEEITTDINESEAIFIVDYRGMTVPQAAELRSKLREADTTFRVVKNTLTQRAADAADAEDLKPMLVGPTAIAFVRGDAAMAAKALAHAQKEYEILDFKGGTLGGRALSIDEIKALSKLPSREVLIGQLVGLAAAPIGGLVRSLGGLLGGLASQLGQIRDQGLVPAAGGAPAEEAPAEGPAAEEAPADEAPAEDPAAEEAPADEAPAEEAPAQEEAADEAPAEEPAAEEAPAEEAEAAAEDEASDDGEETSETEDGGEAASDEAPEETASADGAADGGDGSADDNDDEESGDA